MITETVAYEHGGVKLEGYLACEESAPGKPRPAVLVAHEWWGLNDYVRGRARQLAGLGYVAFALDMYGRGVVTTEAKRAEELAGKFYGKPIMAERARAGLDQLLKAKGVDRARVAAIGYCFGGSTALALAFSGAPLAGVVSFHGGLVPPPAGTAGKVKSKFLICHGANDGFTGWDEASKFVAGMREARLDFQFIAYSGAVHAFTNPEADALNRSNNLGGGIGYNPQADHRSWGHMRQFFDELFQ